MIAVGIGHRLQEDPVLNVRVQIVVLKEPDLGVEDAEVGTAVATRLSQVSQQASQVGAVVDASLSTHL